MSARTALYAGSFDPPTVGHVDLVRRARALFPRVVVAVGVNPAKRPMFEAEERIALLRDALGDVDASYTTFSGLVVACAREVGADVLVRGLRGPQDLELETRNALGNRDLSGIETAFLLSDPRWAHVSSSLVREIARLGGDVSAYVPGPVLARVAARARTPAAG